MYENDDPAWSAMGEMNNKNAELASLRAKLAEWEAAVRVLADEARKSREPCSDDTARMWAEARLRTDANPIAKAALDAAGGAE